MLFCLLVLLAGPSGFLSLVYFLLSACASGQAVVFVSSSVCVCVCLCVVVVVVPVCRSPAGWFVPSRAPGATQCATSSAWGTPHVHWSSGVSVSVSVSGPVGLGLGFTFGFFCFFSLLSVSVAGGLSSSSVWSCCCVLLLLLMRWLAFNCLESG